MTKVSIAIPTWESYGKGSEFIDDLLRTIEIQTFKNFEVCISDHSKDNEVLNKVKEFEDKINILYTRNEENRGNGPANTNKSIDMCSGDIIIKPKEALLLQGVTSKFTCLKTPPLGSFKTKFRNT